MGEPLDFELSFRPAAEGGAGGLQAEARVRLGLDSELRYGPFPVTLDAQALGGLADNPSAYGGALTAAVFADPRGTAAFADARARAAGQNAALRVRLTLPPSLPDLHGLRWELLNDPASGLPLSLNEKTLFSRYLPARADAAAALPPLRGSLRALAAAANPANLSAYRLEKIDTAKELARAARCLSPLRVERLPRAAGDLCTLNRLLERARDADVLYLACHGAYRRGIAALFLEGDDGRVKRAVGDDLAARVAQMERIPRLVVLASCESAGAGAGEATRALGPLLTAAGVPAVLAMQSLVSMTTLDAFLPVLFRELALDGRIDRAVAVARQEVRDQPDWWSPVLYMNLLSGRLWEAQDEPDTPAVAAAVVPREVPPPPANFIGRVAELAELEGAITSGGQVVNIHGTSGVGRTAAARELVRRVIERFPDGQVNLDMQGASARAGLAGAVSAAQALAYVIQRFDPTIAQLPAEENLLRGRLQSLLSGKRALIFLDNVADLSQVAPFLPPPSGCLLLLTAWERLESDEASIYNRFLGKLTPAEAAQLLTALAPRAAPRAAELAERCEYLPQAIDSVARRLNSSSGLSVDDLLELLDDAQERLEITGISAALQVSYDMLSPEQRADWRRLAVFAADFDVSAAAWVWERVDADTPAARLRAKIIRARLDLSDLVGAGVVDYDALSDRYQLHSLERAFALNLPDLDDAEEEAARLAHARAYLAVLKQANQLYLLGNQRILDGLALFDREVGEIRAAWTWLQQGAVADADRARLELRAAYPIAFAQLTAVRLTPDERIAWLESGLAAARALEDRASESNLLSSLGVAYYILDRYADALRCQDAALQSGLSEARQPGGDCDPLARALGNLGALFRATGKTARALRYLQKQLELARRGGLRREEGRALGTLGRAYLDMGAAGQAIASYQDELAITEQTGDRRARAIALGGLGEAYRVQRQYDLAQRNLEEDLAITREIGDRRGQAIASWMLGKVFADAGELAKAVEWMQVLVDYEREIGHQDANWHAKKVADIQARMREE